MGLLDRHLSDDDLERVRRAVEAAEERSAGEIVPYVVEASDDYEAAAWKGAALGALAGVLAAVLVHRLGGYWGGGPLVWGLLPAAAGAAAGFLAAAWALPVRRWLVPAEERELRVERRAAEAFVEREVFATRDRTGILIFLSLFERRVVVMADSGIHARVERPVWEGLADDLAAGIKAGRAAEALVEAVGRCGEILERHGVERRPDDRDELPNRPVRGS